MIKPKNKTIGCRCSEVFFLRVEQLANEVGISNGELLRRSFNYYLNRLKRRDKLIERVRKEVGEKEAEILKAEYDKEEIE